MPVTRQTLPIGKVIRCKSCKKPIYKLVRSITAGSIIKASDLTLIPKVTPKDFRYCPHCDSPWLSVTTGRVF